MKKDVIYRLAKPEDYEALTILWRQVFNDENTFIAQSFALFAGEGQVYVAESEGGVIAQLLAVPCCARDKKGIYLYALATTQSLRSGGVMTGLMQYAEQAEAAKGALFSVLIPASEPLFAYYKKRGYVNEILLRKVEIAAQPFLDEAPVSAQKAFPEASGFLKLRKKWQPAGITFSLERTAFVLDDLQQSGMKFLQTETGYLFYRQHTQFLFVPELFAEDTENAVHLLRQAAGLTGCGRFVTTLAKKSKLFLQQGNDIPSALLKPFSADFKDEKPYFRFGFDEI